MNEQNFYRYLRNKPLSDNGARQSVRHIERLQQWCARKRITDPQQLTYNELLDYVGHLKTKKLSVHTINIHLCSIRYYFDYLIGAGIRESNPANLSSGKGGTLRLKGSIIRVRKDILTTGQMHALYEQFAGKEDFFHPLDRISHQRNIIILSLLIHQGVHSGELKKLETGDIDLQAGTIYIPGSENSNSRTLQLHAGQIMPLNTYLETYRPLLGPQSKELLPGHVQGIMGHLFGQLRKQYPSITNALQLRASAIIAWLKTHNIRQVQYMAGHKHISTTEAYKQQDLEEMQNQLEKHHPFG